MDQASAGGIGPPQQHALRQQSECRNGAASASPEATARYMGRLMSMMGTLLKLLSCLAEKLLAEVLVSSAGASASLEQFSASLEQCSASLEHSVVLCYNRLSAIRLPGGSHCTRPLDVDAATHLTGSLYWEDDR
jgi:hypothetical protein